MTYQPIEKSGWQSFFDAVSKVLPGKGVEVEVEVVGLDLGDQLQMEWLPINGITYDPADDALYIYVEGVDRDLDHMIPSPREVYIELGETGLSQVIVMDQDDHKQFVRFRAPLELPPHVE